MQIHHHSHLLSSASIPTIFFSSPQTPSLSYYFKPPTSLIKKPSSLTLSSPNPSPNLNNTTAGNISNNLTRPDNTLELLTKPEKPDTPLSDEDDDSDSDKPSDDDFAEALAPFLKFFRSEAAANGDNDGDGTGNFTTIHQEPPPLQSPPIITEPPAGLKYYDPKRSDFVVGVVVSGNENKLDVNVGADYLGTMLTKEVLPLHDKELDYLLCDVGKGQGDGVLVKGKMGVVRDEEALSREKVEGRPVIEVGTVIFAEVLGRTLSGRPLLSSRRLYRRVAWHRVRQVLSFLCFSWLQLLPCVLHSNS